ncbi:acyl-CoA--6-aminopenicillanic acid acyl-transferase [Desulfonatronum thiodismutans]|uniref:acyl-CoA--6-aminopenicillanic acid acyl-transferase n=1 Tax=Desulfonatronum thiodismutans TaxID=159290 RepID=UPI0004DB5200|nr:acyl-CoA--6-aminopenicillanic acid acyl-transferase [Desulfonatronum thiodismutans]
MITPHIPVLELSGSPYEIGHAHGSSLKTEIRAFAGTIANVHDVNNPWFNIEHERLSTFAMRNIGFLERFSSDLVQEMRGIADGAGIDFEAVLLLNTFLELEDLRAPTLGGTLLANRLWGCTTFNVSGRDGREGRSFLGQTYDMERYYRDFLCLLRVKPASGPEMLIVTLAGILGLVGLNSAGICAVINKIVATDARPGVIYPFVMRGVLGSERIGDALGNVIFSPRASGLNYQLSSPDAAFCVETSATRYEILSMDGSLAHTNHYVGSTMRQFETPNWLSHGGSMVRKQVADNFLRRSSGNLDPERLKELTRDHTNYPRSICAHGFQDESSEVAFETIFAMIMDPVERHMDLCVGNPCQNHYIRHSLQAKSSDMAE